MASYTKEKLEYLKETKGLIRTAIEAKGQSVSDLDTFRSYADKISSIESAAEPVVQPLNVTENGEYPVPDGVDGFAPVTVNVPDIPAVIHPLSITENGTYTAPANVDGYNPIVVNVASSGGSEDVRYVTFMSYDGLVEYGKKAVAVGDDCADPIARGIFSTPTRESDAQYNYTFYGWATSPNGAADADALKAVEEDKTVYANFTSSVRYYTITYYDSDGTTVLKTESLAYGAMPSYEPSKEDCAFTGWVPKLAEVTGDVSYTAQFIESTTFLDASWDSIASISASGNADKMFSVGDYKVIKLEFKDGTIADTTVRILGFNHDTLADGSGKAGITIGTQYAIVASHFLNTSYFSDGFDSGWPNSRLRTELNNDGLSKLPDDLIPHIKEVVKLSKATVPESVDKLFVPSTTEYGGGTEYGAQYEYYKTANNRKKYKHNGKTISSSTDSHATRIQEDGSTRALSVSSKGEVNTSAGGSILNFSFCFCV